MNLQVNCNFEELLGLLTYMIQEKQNRKKMNNNLNRFRDRRKTIVKYIRKDGVQKHMLRY